MLAESISCFNKKSIEIIIIVITTNLFPQLLCEHSLHILQPMYASLTIVRYPKFFAPFAFFAMAIHRFPLWRNKKISFYKLMGCGKNGAFDKNPDLLQWAIMAVHNITVAGIDKKNITRSLYGSFISGWFHFFNCETFTILLQPLEGHGHWDGKKAFGELNDKKLHEGRVAVLTRATIRPGKITYFWQHVHAVASQMQNAKGFITSVGTGELPWIKQATFSVWESLEDMKGFAYGMQQHKDVIKKTKQQQWYSEDMYVRFRIVDSFGTLRSINPLNRK